MAARSHSALDGHRRRGPPRHLWDYVFTPARHLRRLGADLRLGLLLMLLFALELGWLPATGMDGAAALCFPPSRSASTPRR
jgi:hypothetical protein